MSFKITVIDPAATKRRLSDLLRSEVQKFGQQLATEIRNTTPVDTGRARSGWRERPTSTGYDITNNVPYVGVLDKGRHMTPRGVRGSKQAPRGIVGPSLDTIKRKN
jgi:hypothetical protein